MDAMFDPEIARQLRGRGHDVVAAAEHAELKGLKDPPLFATAQEQQRAIVTENIGDFLQQDELYRLHGRAHHGIILTTNRRFSRASEQHIGRLVLALDVLLRARGDRPTSDSFVHWLR